MIRFYFALWAAKAAKVLIRLFHKVIKKEGTNFPGIVALKLCPNILARIVKPKTVIAVTGTNGKTTMTNMISDCLEAAGYDVTSNRLGSNIITGVTAALVNNATLFNKSKHDIGVLEVDERSSILVYEHVKPTYLVCTNLSRDYSLVPLNTVFIKLHLKCCILPQASHFKRDTFQYSKHPFLSSVFISFPLTELHFFFSNHVTPL